VVEIAASQGQGSGFVYDGDGHIVTNAHVVGGASSVSVKFWNGKSYPAQVVGTDASTDLAVLKVNAPVSELFPLSLGDSTKLVVGYGPDKSLKFLDTEKADLCFSTSVTRFVGERDGVRGAPPASDCEGEDCVQEARVVEDRFRRTALSQLRLNERLDQVHVDALQRATREERGQVHTQRRLVVRQRRSLATEHFEVRQVPPPGLAHIHSLCDRRPREFCFDRPSEFTLGLGLRQAVTRAGLPRWAELSHHLPAVHLELAVVGQAARRPARASA